MRLKQYIKESVDINDRVSFEELLDILWRKCNPFLKDLLKPGWDGEFLFSGRNKARNIFIGQVRKNREPLDTDEKMHNILDDAFENDFDFYARSNAIFCTGKYYQAGEYGSVYMIFPMNKYKFVYSPTIFDLYNVIRTDGQGSGRLSSYEDYYENHTEDYEEQARNDLERVWNTSYSEDMDGHWEYHNMYGTDIELSYGVDKEEAIEHIKEVLKKENEEYKEIWLEWVPDIELEDYINDNITDELNDYNDNIAEDYDEYIKDYINDIVRNKYSNDSILNAIKSNNEIMINCKTYIAIRYDKYFKTLKSYFKENGYKKPNITVIKDWYKKHNGRLPHQLNLFKK